MSIDNSTVVDAIGVERNSGKVILTISDHLDWVDEPNHLVLLREKFNTYLRFIESGEINERFPAAVGRALVIDVVTDHQLTDGAREFFRTTAVVLQRAGVELRTRLLRP